MSACVEIILCLLFPVTVVRISMNHEVTGNKIEQANVQNDLTYHGTYGWLFENTHDVFRNDSRAKIEFFWAGLALKRRRGLCGLSFYDGSMKMSLQSWMAQIS